MSAMDDDVAFQKLEHNTADVVLVVNYNLYGSRMVTGASDHQLRVWDKKGLEWVLNDVWRAHDAEITDVKWNAPFTGALVASISTDGFCKLWLEAPTVEPRSGRRFTLIHAIPSKSLLPWQSLEFKAVNHETYLALTSYDGNLSVFEPKHHDDLAGEWMDWFASSDFYIVEPLPQRSEETGFHISWHQERLPCWSAVEAGLDRKSMGLAVAAMETVKVLRTDRERRFYLAAELTGATDIIRGVAWSNGAMRGFDIIATASKDGIVRVYQLTTPPKRYSTTTNSHDMDVPVQQQSQTAPSGIGAGLAEISRPNYAQGQDHQPHDPHHVKQDVRLVAELNGHQGAVWRVNFSFTGDILMSTGDDGSVKTWKRTFDGGWEEYADIDVDVDEEDDIEDEDDEEISEE